MRGVWFAEKFIAAFIVLFVGIWAVFVLPLFFEAPHPVGLPGLDGTTAAFPTSSYLIAEIGGTATFLAPAIFFAGVGVVVYRRARHDVRTMRASGGA